MLQHEILDKFIKKWVSEYRATGKTIFCCEGCSGCCNLAVHATLPEAIEIAKQLTPRQSRLIAAYIKRLREVLPATKGMKNYLKKHREYIGPCPFLDEEGCCEIYHIRPLSCRALLSTRPADWCKVDFSELNPWDKKAFASSLDIEVVAWPTHYVAATQRFARELENLILAKMKQTYGYAMSGNFIVMVWLETSQKQSLTAMSLERVRDLLREEPYDNQLMLNLCHDARKIHQGTKPAQRG